jgi:hypothetical protein
MLDRILKVVIKTILGSGAMKFTDVSEKETASIFMVR